MSNYPRFDTKLFSEIWERADEFIQDYQTNGIPMTITTSNATILYYLLYARYGNNPIANYDEEQFKYKVFSIIWSNGPTWQKRLEVQNTLRTMQLSDLINDGQIAELFSSQGSNSQTASGTSGNTRTLNTQEANTGTQAVARTGTDTTASTGTQAVAHTGTVRTQGDSEDIKNHAYNPGTAPATDAYSPLTYINEQHATKNDIDNTTTYNNTDTTTNNLQNQTTHNTTDTTTNNLNKADTGTITDAGTTSETVSGTDSKSNNLTRTLTSGKLKAYEKLLELLDADVTSEFVSKFKVCFKQFVMPEMTWIYVTELDDEEDDE